MVATVISDELHTTVPVAVVDKVVVSDKHKELSPVIAGVAGDANCASFVKFEAGETQPELLFVAVTV